MANIFQRIGQKLKDVAGGVYHQFATNDGGQNFRSYMDEEETRRRLQQQQMAQQRAAQAARRNAPQNGGLTVQQSRPAAHINIGQPDNSQSNGGIKLKVSTAAPTAQIKVPTGQPSNQPAPETFKGFTLGKGKNKTIFGWNAAALLPKQYEKTYGIKVDRNIQTGRDAFLNEYDKLNPDFQKVYTNTVIEQAKKGDKDAIHTLKTLTDTGRMKGGVLRPDGHQGVPARRAPEAGRARRHQRHPRSAGHRLRPHPGR